MGRHPCDRVSGRPAVLLSGFVLWQSKGPNPLLPLRVVRNRNRAGSFITILLAVTGMFGTFLFLTYLLQTIDHYSPSRPASPSSR